MIKQPDDQWIPFWVQTAIAVFSGIGIGIIIGYVLVFM